MTETNKMTLAVGAVVFGTAVLINAFLGGPGLTPAGLLPAAATLFASYFGATYAFTLQRQQKVEEERRKRIIAGNIAIFILGQQLNALWNIQRKSIDPVRGNPFFFIEMEPALPWSYDRLRFNLESLYFLLETDHRNLLFEVSLMETRFHKAIRLFDERSRLYIEEVMPALSRAGIRDRITNPPESLEPTLGHPLYVRLHSMTKDVVAIIDTLAEELSDTAARFSKVMGELFKGEKIVSVQIDKT